MMVIVCSRVQETCQRRIAKDVLPYLARPAPSVRPLCPPPLPAPSARPLCPSRPPIAAKNSMLNTHTREHPLEPTQTVYVITMMMSDDDV